MTVTSVHDGRRLQIGQHPPGLGLVQHLAVDVRPTVRASAVEDPGGTEGLLGHRW